MTNSDALISIVRTTMAFLIGSVTTWLASRIGLVIDEDTKAQVTVIFTFAVTTAVYSIIRTLESKWPGVGILFGIKRAPLYVAPTDTVAVTDAQTGVTTTKREGSSGTP